jgi:hypothetical protein
MEAGHHPVSPIVKGGVCVCVKGEQHHPAPTHAHTLHAAAHKITNASCTQRSVPQFAGDKLPSTSSRIITNRITCAGKGTSRAEYVHGRVGGQVGVWSHKQRTTHVSGMLANPRRRLMLCVGSNTSCSREGGRGGGNHDTTQDAELSVMGHQGLDVSS